MSGSHLCHRVLFLLLAGVLTCPVASGQLSVDEEKQMRWHPPRQILQYFTQAGPQPVTVATKDPGTPDRLLPLDEAIQLALQHSEVIRVLTGVSAVSSGSTIYDTAISNTGIDQAVGRFDPVFFANNTYRDAEQPFAGPSLGNPALADIFGSQTATNAASIGTRRTNRLGGQAEFSFSHDWTRNRADGTPAFNPSERPALALSYTQPLLAGAGRDANEAPIVIARLELDRSYFQYKGRVQDLVRSVIAGYWGLVNARTILWAREQQMRLLKFSLERETAQQKTGRVDLSVTAQSRVAFANIRASLLAAQADVLQREAALRNALGLPPEDGTRLVPSTPPTRQQLQFVWQELFETAQQNRPDLIELNLILQADLNRLTQSRNLAQPSLDATAIHRWNGLRGTLADGSTVASSPGDNTDWSLGITFSVPVGLRSQRAQLRSAELLIARDRANIQQGLHATRHTIATNIRDLDSSWLQYEAFQETRAAAAENLEAQSARAATGAAEYLVFLQAVSDWGNAVSSESSSLAQYNSGLAQLETETGTILETHAVTFVEERFASVGPWGRRHRDHCYPRDLRSLRSQERYDSGNVPAERSFRLKDYDERFERLQERLQRGGLPSSSGPRDQSSSGVSSSRKPPKKVAERSSSRKRLYRMKSVDSLFR